MRLQSKQVLDVAAAAALAIIGLAMPVARGADDVPSSGLEEITVTATKREENLQVVPISVTAISAETLATTGVEDVLSLQQSVSGLVYTLNAGQATPRIRGVGTAISVAGNEQAVATYVDGVYYASALGSIMTFNNVDQVAVLKGPQGTLFGRNTTGGLIQITTREPGQEFVGKADVSVGNLNTIGANLYLGGGVTASAAADLAIHYKNQQDGFGTNLFNGKDVNRGRELAVRSKWKFSLGDATNITLIADYTDTKTAGTAFRPYPGELPITRTPFTGGDFDANSDNQPFSDLEQYGASLKLTHDFEAVQFLSISAYRKTNWRTAFDSDALPVHLLYATISEPDRQLSQELQLLSTGPSALEWVVGAYYFDGSGGYLPGVVDVVPAGLVNTLFSKQTAKSYSVFGQGTRELGEMTSATLGLRWTSEKKSIVGSGNLFFPARGFAVPQGPIADEETINKLTWRASLNHRINDDVMIYGSYNRGFKSGGYDPTSVGVAKYIQPEVLDAVEAGFKSEFFDKRLRMNGAIYYYDYTNLQLNTFVSGLLTVYNGDSAKIKGLDLEITAAPSDRLLLSLGVSVVHGRYGDFPVTQTASLPTGGIVQLADISASGKSLINTPDWTADIGIQYTVPLSQGSLKFAANYFHSDGWYNAPENRTRLAPYSLVNASVKWSSDNDDKLTVQLWGRNLGDEFYYDQITNQVPVLDFVSAAPGRTFGVTFGFTF